MAKTEGTFRAGETGGKMKAVSKGRTEPPYPRRPAPRVGEAVDIGGSPVCVPVPVDALDRLCLLAREAGEDLQAAAWREYPGDFPSEVRRRTNDIAAAQELIDLAAALAPAAK